jgi:hypothetical protein
MGDQIMNKLVIDTITNEESIVKFNAAEIKQSAADQLLNDAILQKEAVAKAAKLNSIEKLTALGLTTDDLIALGLLSEPTIQAAE